MCRYVRGAAADAGNGFVAACEVNVGVAREVDDTGGIR